MPNTTINNENLDIETLPDDLLIFMEVIEHMGDEIGQVLNDVASTIGAALNVARDLISSALEGFNRFLDFIEIDMGDVLAGFFVAIGTIISAAVIAALAPASSIGVGLASITAAILGIFATLASAANEALDEIDAEKQSRGPHGGPQVERAPKPGLESSADASPFFPAEVEETLAANSERVSGALAVVDEVILKSSEKLADAIGKQKQVIDDVIQTTATDVAPIIQNLDDDLSQIFVNASRTTLSACHGIVKRYRTQQENRRANTVRQMASFQQTSFV